MEQRLPLVVDLHINKFSGGEVTEKESGISNGMIETKNGRPYVTQRPAIDVFGDASTDISDARGRGIYYWEAEPALYMINDGTLYKGTYGTSISTSPTAGTEKCRFFEVGSVLVLLDAENNQGFTIDTSDVVTEITDTDFPPKDTPSVGITHGGAVLDTYLFVLDEDGEIHHCDSNDATAWNALSFLGADREPDGGVYLGKHHDNIVAIGVSTIEFFYNAGNATGSVLNRREDISYNIGCVDGQSVWEEGDRMFFLGTNYSGGLAVYMLQGFQLKKVSNSTVDSFLTQAVQRDGYGAIGSGLTGAGHIFYTLTLHTTPDDVSPEVTLAYDPDTGLWGEWNATVNGLTNFDLMAWTKRTGASARYGEGILTNGDLISLNDNAGGQDTLLGASYVESGYVLAGYVQETADTGTPIDLAIRMGMFDGGTNRYKYPTSIRHTGDRTPNSQTLTVSWADENNTSFNTGRALDTSKNQKAHRLGRFQRRNHNLAYSGSDRIWMEGLEVKFEVGED